MCDKTLVTFSCYKDLKRYITFLYKKVNNKMKKNLKDFKKPKKIIKTFAVPQKVYEDFQKTMAGMDLTVSGALTSFMSELTEAVKEGRKEIGFILEDDKNKGGKARSNL